MSRFELVVHHRYQSGTAVDLSGYANDGHATTHISAESDSVEADGMLFDGHATRVVVFPSPSLRNLGGIRARARVRVDDLGDRRTIMEGYLSFSLSVEPDGSLRGSIYTGLEWHLVQTSPGSIEERRWSDVEFVYNGRDSATLSVNDRLAAARYAHLGRLSDVEWPYGLNVGAWPDENARAFSGHIAELWLWRMRE